MNRSFFNWKIPLNLQEYLLIQYVVLLSQHLVLLESKTHMNSKSYFKRLSLLKITRIISLCEYR